MVKAWLVLGVASGKLDVNFMVDNFQVVAAVVLLILESPHRRTAAKFRGNFRTYLVASRAKVVLCSDRRTAALSVLTERTVTVDSRNITGIEVAVTGEPKTSAADGNVIRYNSAVVVNLFAVHSDLAAPVFLSNEPAVSVQVRAGEVVEENLGIFRKNSGFRK